MRGVARKIGKEMAPEIVGIAKAGADATKELMKK